MMYHIIDISSRALEEDINWLSYPIDLSPNILPLKICPRFHISRFSFVNIESILLKVSKAAAQPTIACTIKGSLAQYRQRQHVFRPLFFWASVQSEAWTAGRPSYGISTKGHQQHSHHLRHVAKDLWEGACASLEFTTGCIAKKDVQSSENFTLILTHVFHPVARPPVSFYLTKASSTMSFNIRFMITVNTELIPPLRNKGGFHRSWSSIGCSKKVAPKTRAKIQALKPLRASLKMMNLRKFRKHFLRSTLTS